MSKIWNADEDTRSLKSLLLFGIKGMAAYAYHARVLNRTDDIVNRFFYEALKALGEPLPADALLGARPQDRRSQPALHEALR